MKVLIEKIMKIPDVYDDFVLGVVNYAKMNPDHVVVLNEFMDSKKDVMTSDVVEFIMKQPDFHTYSANLKKNVS
ncbi:MAG: hypothetical protein MJ093_03040 [Saccharofermentans sp.]|nr:hypothetical protein [Saccharofermentans sp.]